MECPEASQADDIVSSKSDTYRNSFGIYYELYNKTYIIRNQSICEVLNLHWARVKKHGPSSFILKDEIIMMIYGVSHRFIVKVF